MGARGRRGGGRERPSFFGMENRKNNLAEINLWPSIPASLRECMGDVQRQAEIRDPESW